MAKIKPNVFTNSINSVGNVNNISDKNEEKEQEILQEKEQQEETVTPGSVGENNTEKSMSALDIAARLGKTSVVSQNEASAPSKDTTTFTEEGITFNVIKDAENAEINYKLADDTLTINASNCTIDVEELLNSDIKVVLNGENVTLNSDKEFSEITNNASNSTINSVNNLSTITNNAQNAEIIGIEGLETDTTTRGGFNGFASDGKLYEDGELFSGVHTDNLLYKDGELFNGHCEDDGLEYKDGDYLTGLNKDNVCFKNGEVADNVVVDGIYYVNGEKATGETYEENSDMRFLNGEPLNGISEVDHCLYQQGSRPLGTVEYEGDTYVNGTLVENSKGETLHNYTFPNDFNPANEIEFLKDLYIAYMQTAEYEYTEENEDEEESVYPIQFGTNDDCTVSFITNKYELKFLEGNNLPDDYYIVQFGDGPDDGGEDFEEEETDELPQKLKLAA